MFIQTCVSYIYWIVNLNVVYLPGDALTNAMILGFAEFGSIGISGVVLSKYPATLVIKVSLMVTFVFGILFIAVPYDEVVPFLILVTILGVGSAYNSMFVIMEEKSPV